MNPSIAVLTPKMADNPILSAFFTYRHPLFSNDGLASTLRRVHEQDGDTDHIQIQRKKLFEKLGLDSEKTAWAHQVHGNNVKYVTRGGVYAGIDALVTTTRGISLIIQVADCAAVLLADTRHPCIAAIHAGWRGAAAQIVPKTIAKMEKTGAEAENMEAFISPCISLQNFEVGNEVAVKFPNEVVDRTTYVKPHVNLKKFIATQLQEAGLQKNNIEISSVCTVENEDRLYSYRREKEQSGRMLAVISLKSAS